MARGIAVKGRRYRHLVLKVLGRDEGGRPRLVECLYDEDTTRVEGGEHFWVVLAPADMAAKKPSRLH